MASGEKGVEEKAYGRRGGEKSPTSAESLCFVKKLNGSRRAEVHRRRRKEIRKGYTEYTASETESARVGERLGSLPVCIIRAFPAEWGSRPSKIVFRIRLLAGATEREAAEAEIKRRAGERNRRSGGKGERERESAITIIIS